MPASADRMRDRLGPDDWEWLARMGELRLTFEYEILGPARHNLAWLRLMTYETVACLVIPLAHDIAALERIEGGGDRLEARYQRAIALTWAAHREALDRLGRRHKQQDVDP